MKKLICPGMAEHFVFQGRACVSLKAACTIVTGGISQSIELPLGVVVIGVLP